MTSLAELNERSREILREIVDAYMETGEPVGSRTLSRRLQQTLSPASIRNTMADLVDAGLIAAPHTSAGRVPTEAGLRLFVDGLLEVGRLGEDERRAIEAQCHAAGRSVTDVLNEATGVLSGLSRCAGLVVAQKTDRPVRQIEFVSLGPGRALAIIVTEGGLVENRLIELPLDVPVSALMIATNYLNARLAGRTLSESRAQIEREIADQRSELDGLTRRVIEAGLATWGNAEKEHLIIRGQGNLLDDVAAAADLERIRQLFEVLETRETLVRLLDAAAGGDGVQIFIGAENGLFRHSGCSVVISPYMNAEAKIVGAIGVIGPTRINYARIIPMVDYTAKVVGRLIA
jgi:heat-inducible transcriptional repressor